MVGGTNSVQRGSSVAHSNFLRGSSLKLKPVISLEQLGPGFPETLLHQAILKVVIGSDAFSTVDVSDIVNYSILQYLQQARVPRATPPCTDWCRNCGQAR